MTFGVMGVAGDGHSELDRQMLTRAEQVEQGMWDADLEEQLKVARTDRLKEIIRQRINQIS